MLGMQMRVAACRTLGHADATEVRAAALTAALQRKASIEVKEGLTARRAGAAQRQDVIDDGRANGCDGVVLNFPAAQLLAQRGKLRVVLGRQLCLVHAAPGIQVRSERRCRRVQRDLLQRTAVRCH